jgi:hypothetical protein
MMHEPTPRKLLPPVHPTHSRINGWIGSVSGVDNVEPYLLIIIIHFSRDYYNYFYFLTSLTIYMFTSNAREQLFFFFF